MKKFLGILILGILLSTNISFAQADEVSKEAKERCTAGGGAIQNDGTCLWNTPPSIQGIKMNKDCLLNGQCGFNIYEFLGIRTSIADNSSPELFIQDILLSATFFIGTVVTIGIIVSGLMFIFAGATGKDPTKAKSGLKNSFIGLLLVISSYSIIRIVQYIAKGG